MDRIVDGNFLRAAFLDSWRSGPFAARLAAHLACALAFMELAIWFHSGTLSPYSVVPHPTDLLGCGYTGNTDHGEFVRSYRMLAGMPSDEWIHGSMLRRLLYPVVAFPFYATFGFTIGGFIANLAIHGAMLASWAWFLFVTVGRRGAVAGVWLLASWPGIFYWAGLPYSYAAIVPLSVWSFMLLYYLGSPRSLRATFLSCLAIGVMWQAYDAFVVFGVAALLLIAWRDRRPLALLLGLVGILAPEIATVWLMVHAFHVPSLETGNTVVYRNILEAYWNALHGEVDWRAWGALIVQLPAVLAGVFFDSAMAVVPALFLVLVLVNRVWRLIRFHPAEMALAAVFLAVFLFNNLAPPYPGWQLRGDWIARLYQPLFVIYLFFAARLVKAVLVRQWRVRFAVAVPIAAAVALDVALALGGMVANWQPTSLVYYRFYHQIGPDAYREHLATYGRRPLGFCVRDGHWPDLVHSVE